MTAPVSSQRVNPVGTGSAQSIQNAYAIASKYLGTPIATSKNNPEMAAFLNKGIPNDVCCANFVSACLEKAGQLRPDQHNNSAAGLASQLSSDKANWDTSTNI